MDSTAARDVTFNTRRRPEVTTGIAITPYPDFSMRPDLIAEGRSDAPAQSRRVGDVRTRDRRVAPETYNELLCGWTQQYDQGSRESCRLAGQPLVDELLGEIQRAGASVEADLVHHVRCFGSNEGRYLRVWCEGEAYLTTEYAARACAVAALK